MIKAFALNLAHIANNELDTVVFINTGVTLVGQIDQGLRKIDRDHFSTAFCQLDRDHARPTACIKDLLTGEVLRQPAQQ